VDCGFNSLQQESPEAAAMNARVMVGMSGGVDSSVAALLLRRAGYDVVGATMKLFAEKETPPVETARRAVSDACETETGRRAVSDAWEAETGHRPVSTREGPPVSETHTAETGHRPVSTAPGPPADGLCCSWESVERARQVCEVIGIRHYVLNMTDEFRRDVIEHFIHQYRLGLTPNPCLRCNELIKWGAMLRRARGIGCEAIATGHYAIVEPADTGRIALRRGVDRGKDQSYALYMLSQDELAHTLLPLGGLTKAQVRSLAAEAGLPTAETAESQDICFVPGGDYRALFGPEAMQPGPILDLDGRELGRHRGLPAYTVGQRKGLGVAAGEPLYVIRKDTERNALVVGTREQAVRRAFSVREVNWVFIASPEVGESLRADIEVRYRTKPVTGTVEVLTPSVVECRIGETDQVAAPGQSAVFYRGDVVLGGGVIAGDG